MIISEKQIMQLYDIARMCCEILISFEINPQNIDEIVILLETIRNQQSEDLKVIK